MSFTRSDYVRFANSTLAFALAFNLLFLVHEIGLVVGARLLGAEEAMLFHNNMSFRMTDDVQNLAFGIGSVAVALVGLAALLFWCRLPASREISRLLSAWLFFHGLFLFLGQVPSVSHSDEGDVAKVVVYLGWSLGARRLVAGMALVSLVALGIVFGRMMLSAQASEAELETTRSRVLLVVLLILGPWLIGSLLSVPFRVLPWGRAILPFMTLLALVWSLGAARVWRSPCPGRLGARPDGHRMFAWQWATALGVYLVLVRLVLVPGLPIP